MTVKPLRKSRRDNSLDSVIYRGRFAPSPTGPLHFGSLIAATASYLEAKHNQGTWLLRIEDIDTFRCRAEHADHILQTLEAFGFQWDEPVLYQTQRHTAYQQALETINSQIYPCFCTRRVLRVSCKRGQCGLIYPATCRNLTTPNVQKQHSIRLKTCDEIICVNDPLQGTFCQNIKQDIGDYILKRSDGLFAYQLAVVVDDADAGITDIVRGYDLLDNTPRQIYLQQCLGYPTPNYLHIPLITYQDGRKLSKQNLTPGIDAQASIQLLYHALNFLGQNPPNPSQFSTIDDFWQWAIENWTISSVPTIKQKYYDYTL